MCRLANGCCFRMRSSCLFICLISLMSCHLESNSKLSIKGSWYLDFGNGVNSDSINYAEAYVNDTILYFQDELIGQTRDQSYRLSGDSILKCFDASKDCKYIPMYKILKISNDTLFLIVHPKYRKGDNRTYWVRLPKNEFGHYDLNWTVQNRDSLRKKVVVDYQRRQDWFYATKYHVMKSFDSLVNAGYYNWSMKNFARDTETKNQ